MEQVANPQGKRAWAGISPAPAGWRLAVAGLLMLSLCAAADVPPLEYQVKAAFLLNFTKFVDWPSAAFEDDHSPLTICILGEDPFGTALNQMVKGEVVNGRRLVVERIRNMPEPKSCQVLFVGQQEKEVGRILAEAGPGVLTVGEGESFLHEGGTVAFVIENRRVRFDISQKAASNARLTVSSRLLSVARWVEK